MEIETLRVTVSGPVCVVTLSRPEVLNAMDSRMRHEIGLVMAEVDRAKEIRVVVLEGAGDRAFSVGADLKEMAQGAEEGRFGDGHAFPIPGIDRGVGIAAVGECAKPVIAAIDGYCLAAGFEVALQSDIRLATRQSTFGLPEPRRGLLGDTGLHELCRVVPLGEALQMQLTGQSMAASRAYEIGLVQGLFDDRAALDGAALALAEEVCACSPFAVRAIKRIVRGGRHLTIEDAARLAQPYHRLASEGYDAREGSKAFAEKRAPRWSDS